MTDAQNADQAAPAQPYDALVEAKRLLRVIRAGALATLSPPESAPFASLVNVATTPDGSPILLVSQLAAHTRHIAADPRVSLLLAQGGEGDPLAHPRLTLMGRAERVSDPIARAKLKARFLAKHPRSALYADFADFSFWQVALDHGYLNGGFGRTGSFPAAALMTSIAQADGLVGAEAEALAHINSAHKDALALYAAALAGAPNGAWRAIGLDPDGLDLTFGDQTVRIMLPRSVHTLEELREALAEFAEAAKRLGERR